MANVLFKRGNTATINGTAISDGQLLYNTTTGQQYIDSGSTRKEVGKPVDTTLSTTSTNAIANNALTNSIINTTAEVSAITADNIPCGTKPVKELINSLTANAKHFYFDYKDGKYGYNTSELRGADTFTPFKSGLTLIKQEGNIASSQSMSQITYYDTISISSITMDLNTSFNNCPGATVLIIGYSDKSNLTNGTTILSYTGAINGRNTQAERTIDVSNYEAISIKCGAEASGVCSSYIIRNYS